MAIQTHKSPLSSSKSSLLSVPGSVQAQPMSYRQTESLRKASLDACGLPCREKSPDAVCQRQITTTKGKMHSSPSLTDTKAPCCSRPPLLHVGTASGPPLLLHEASRSLLDLDESNPVAKRAESFWPESDVVDTSTDVPRKSKSSNGGLRKVWKREGDTPRSNKDHPNTRLLPPEPLSPTSSTTSSRSRRGVKNLLNNLKSHVAR